MLTLTDNRKSWKAPTKFILFRDTFLSRTTPGGSSYLALSYVSEGQLARLTRNAPLRGLEFRASGLQLPATQRLCDSSIRNNVLTLADQASAPSLYN